MASRKAPSRERDRFDPPETAKGRAEAALALINETRALFHRLKLAVEALHRGRLKGAERGILMDLARLGPSTVPALARMRPVSRQHIQNGMNALLKKGWVALEDNPSHKRSKLARLTPSGQDYVRQVVERERKILERLPLDLGERELTSAARVLRLFRSALREAEL